jgi:cyclophilin family peptidyl-prolyl cis-trans isomerase
MARTSEVDSATSQFFINLNDNAFLDHGGRDFGYAVFGRVAEGMDVVDAIARVSTQTKAGQSDVPVEPVTIVTVRLPD